MLSTKSKVIIYDPNIEKGVECYVDADFAGGWKKTIADQGENLLSRTGYVICYAGCPIIWTSKLQTEIALSTSESEYIALSTEMCEIIPLMNVLIEISKTFTLYLPNPIIKCKVFEDKESCITLSKATKFSPRTKHIDLK